MGSWLALLTLLVEVVVEVVLGTELADQVVRAHDREASLFAFVRMVGFHSFYSSGNI